MAITYTWTIANMERNTADDSVTIAHWRCSGDDGNGNTASSCGTTSHTGVPSDPDFIAYASLTEADVLGWVHDAIDQTATETAIADKINAMANPTTASGTPW